MTLAIVPIYAAALGALFVVLTVRAFRARRQAQVPVGPLGDEALDRRIRAHGNFAEYAPLALLLLGFAEWRAAAAGLVHLGAAALLAGRIAHAWGVSRVAENFAFRKFGMAATFAAYTIAILAILGTYF